MEYFRASEQVASVVAVGSIVKDDRIVAAGGYVVQLLPELLAKSIAALKCGERCKLVSARVSRARHGYVACRLKAIAHELPKIHRARRQLYRGFPGSLPGEVRP